MIITGMEFPTTELAFMAPTNDISVDEIISTCRENDTVNGDVISKLIDALDAMRTNVTCNRIKRDIYATKLSDLISECLCNDCMKAQERSPSGIITSDESRNKNLETNSNIGSEVEEMDEKEMDDDDNNNR